MTDFAAAAEAIVAVGSRLDSRGLAPATAGNYSQRLDDGSIAVTVSGAHKGRLTTEQVMRVSADGAALDGKKPSAETLLHCLVYALDPGAGAVLHTHSVAGTVLSRALAGQDTIVLAGYELLKIFPGHPTHDASVAIPLVDNSQDMAALAAQLRPILAAQTPPLPVFYIRGHGLYAWGATMDAAEYVTEASEFLLSCALEELEIAGRTTMTTLALYDDTAPHAHRGTQHDYAAIAAALAAHGVRLERWEADAALADDAEDGDILAAYAGDIETLKAAGGYQSCDVIRMTPDHPEREALRAKFLAEHVHDDDEVRFFVEGSGLFYIRAAGVVHALECTAGDLILLPAGTVHWFDTGERPRFTAIRLFTTPEGWVARFTGDPIAEAIPRYEPAL